MARGAAKGGLRLATVVDALVVTLGLDASHFKRESGTINVYLKDTRDNAERTARELDARGVQASQFFSRIKNEALGLVGVLVGARGLKDFISGTTNDLASLGRAAQNMGMGIADLAAFRNMIERNGGSADEAAGAFQRMADQVERFNTFGEGSPDFIGAKNVIGSGRGDTPMETFLKFSKFAEEHAKEPLRVRMIGQMLGFDQSSINAAMLGVDRVIRELAEAKRRGLPTEQMSQQAKELQHDWHALSEAARHLGDVVFTYVEPSLHKMLNWAEDMIVNDPKTTEAIAGITSGLIALGAVRIAANVIGLGGLYTAISAIAVLTGAIVADIAGIADFINRPSGNIPNSDFERGEIERYRKEHGLPPMHPTTLEAYPGSNSLSPRGIRNNNPLNLEYRENQGAIGSDGRFGVYSTMAEGIAAAERQLLLYQDRDGLNTIRGIISKWAPPNENDTASYIAAVSAAMGVGPDVPLDLRNRQTAESLISAMIRRETGQSIDPATVSRGFDIGTNRMGPRVPVPDMPDGSFGAPNIPGFDPALSPTPRIRMPAPAPAAPSQKSGIPDITGSPGAPTIGNITVGRIDVHTQATDARGIARDLAGELISQANRGLT
jgi:hypothetical protein